MSRLFHRIASGAKLQFRRERAEKDLREEIDACVDILAERKLAQGVGAEEARRQARMELEGPEQLKEQVRDARAGATLDSFLQDVRYAFRTLRRSPGLSAVAILTLALGIGLNTAIFGVLYAVVLEPLPYHQPERLALVWSSFEKLGTARAPMSGALLKEILERNSSLEGAGAIWVGTGTFTGDANPEQVKVASVTTNFLSLLGVRPQLGRLFTDEEAAGGRPAVILSDALWRRRFAADPGIIGKGVAFSGRNMTVVGVLPADFRLHFPADSNVPADVPAFTPFPNAIFKGPRTLYYLRVLVRAKPGVSPQDAQRDLDRVALETRNAYTEFAAERLTFHVTPMQGDAVREIRPVLTALFAGSTLVIVVVCINVVNLLLARAGQRGKEMALRASLGASASRIVRQLVTEGVVLCTAGFLGGIALGWLALRWFASTRPDQLARYRTATLDWQMLAYAGGISLAAALLFGLAPALEALKTNLVERLRDTRGGARSAAYGKLRAGLITCEVSLGFLLLIAAGLLLQTLWNLRQERAGMDARGVLTFEVDLPGRQYPLDAARAAVVKRWEARLAEIPGVIAVGGVSHLPLDDYPNWYGPYRPEGVSENAGAAMLADQRAITPGYFQAMGTKLLEGRHFEPLDQAQSRLVAIVDETLARAAWPGRSALGQKLNVERWNNGAFVPVWTEVVGVVEHIRHHGLATQLRGQVYLPYEQSSRPHLSYAVRASGDPMELAGQVRAELRKLDPDLALSKVRPMQAYIDKARAPADLTAKLAAVFALFTLLLTALGVHGVIDYSVSRRMPEMGIRMALGASHADVRKLVFREGLQPAVFGVALGIAASIAGAKWLASLTYGVSPFDPATYATAFTVVAITALIGCWRPARKAAGANPAEIIRNE
jgi:putative ABC transport system permease protein